MRILVALALTVASFGAACSGAVQTPEGVLEEQLRAFESHLRWGRFDEAAAYVATGERGAFLGFYAELGDDFEITELEMRAVVVDPRDHSAVVTRWMTWFRLPSTLMREATFTETWAYDDDARRWMMSARTEEQE